MRTKALQNMVITDKDRGIADPAKVTSELTKLFAGLKEDAGDEAVFKKVRPYVIAVDPDFPDSSADGWYSRNELVELRCCTKLFDAQIYCLKKQQKQADAVRVMLFSYLHIIEADYPAALVLNALNFLEGGNPEWTFFKTNGENEPHIAEHPKEKFKQISSKAEIKSPELAAVFNQLFKSKLRNAVAHSHFHIDENGTVFLTKDYSPISRVRKSVEIAGTVCTTYTREAVERIYEGAKQYWKCADELYRWFENLDKMEQSPEPGSEPGSV